MSPILESTCETLLKPKQSYVWTNPLKLTLREIERDSLRVYRGYSIFESY